MLGAGTVINPIIKIVTTVAILGACYLFFVKPALDTTEDITDRAFDTSDSIQESIQKDLKKSFKGVPNSNQIENDIQSSINSSGGGQIQVQKLQRCVQKVAPDVNKMQACVNRFGP